MVAKKPNYTFLPSDIYIDKKRLITFDNAAI